MSEQERRRRATYDFFNRRESSQKKTELPLYRRRPEYFIGGALFLLFMWDLMVKSLRVTKAGLAKSYPLKPQSEAGRSLNFKRRFDGEKEREGRTGRVGE